MNKCKVCNTENADTATYCINCGSVLSSTCPSCGADITNAECFCPTCGAIVHIQKTETVSIQEPGPNTKPIIHVEPEAKPMNPALKVALMFGFFIMVSAPVFITFLLHFFLDTWGGSA